MLLYMSSSTDDVVPLFQEDEINYMDKMLYEVMPYIKVKINGVPIVVKTKESEQYKNMTMKEFLDE